MNSREVVLECDNKNGEELFAEPLGEQAISLLGGRVIFGLVLDEREDSFLVLLASTLTSDGTIVDGKLLTASPVIRVFKSSIIFMADPEPEHRFYYFRHISKLTAMWPEFFTPGRMATLQKVIAEGSGMEGWNQGSASTDSEDDMGVDPTKIHPYRSTTRH